jgi:hypothetical protein
MNCPDHGLMEELVCPEGIIWCCFECCYWEGVCNV